MPKVTGRRPHLLATVVAVVCLVASPITAGATTGRGQTGQFFRAVQHDDGTAVHAMVPSPEAASPVAASPVAVASSVDSSPWSGAIDRLLAGEDGVYGVVLMRPDGTVLYRRDGELPFVAASLYKLILLADICQQAEAGWLSLDTPLTIDPSFFDESIDGLDSYFDPSFAGYDTTVGEALNAAGAYSSNVAARALLTLTTGDRLASIAAALGLTGTHLSIAPDNIPDWPPLAAADTSRADAKMTKRFVTAYAYDGEVNVTTPMDMARYFQLLLEGRLIDHTVSKMVTKILSRQMIDDRFPALLPAGTRLIHKTGNLDFVVHDVGIIYGADGPVILVAMAQAQRNDDRTAQVEQRLALIAYGDYDLPPIPAAPAGTPVAGAGVTPSPPPAVLPEPTVDAALDGSADGDWVDDESVPLDDAVADEPTEPPADEWSEPTSDDVEDSG